MEINDYNGAYEPDYDIYAPARRDGRSLPYVRYSLTENLSRAKRYAYRRRFPRPDVYTEFDDLYDFDEVPF